MSNQSSRVQRIFNWSALLSIVLVGLIVRIMLSPQIDGIDDSLYLAAANTVAHDAENIDRSSLAFLRVGMSQILGWMVKQEILEPNQFWVLTCFAELLSMASLALIGGLIKGFRGTLVSAALYAAYPLAVFQSTMYVPMPFQVATISIALYFFLALPQGSFLKTIFPFVAGVSLGIGYLFKEDTALLVPAILLTASCLRFKSTFFLAVFACGAASVFIAECFLYWHAQGAPFFRLQMTSGMAASVGEHLEYSKVWHWSQFFMTLLVLPHNVSIFWWLAIPACFRALSSTIKTETFLVAVFLLVALYLQVGTNSLSTYVPLPKGPRYTAILTPFLILLITSWFVRIWERRTRLALSLTIIWLLATVLCLGWGTLRASERARNSLAILTFLKNNDIHEVYTDFYSARRLNILMGDGFEAHTWIHADFSNEQMTINENQEDMLGKFVLIDNQSCKLYTSAISGYAMDFPDDIEKITQNWPIVWTSRAYADRSLQRKTLEAFRNSLQQFAPKSVADSVSRKVNDIIENDTAFLYHVPL